jgi:helicase
LVEAVIDRTGRYQYVDPDGREQNIQLLPYGVVVQRSEKPSAQDVIVPLAQQLIRGTTEKVIVFRNQRGPAEGCARYLARDVGLPPAIDALRQLPERDLSTTSASLRLCLNGGTAFHNTNLTREEKQVTSAAFETPTAHFEFLVLQPHLQPESTRRLRP